jgi:amino acid transporter
VRCIPFTGAGARPDVPIGMPNPSLGAGRSGRGTFAWAAAGAVLARMAYIAAGRTFQMWVSADAFLVLGGSVSAAHNGQHKPALSATHRAHVVVQVLTSYVGVNGLIQKMAMDRCFPQALMSLNPWRFTNHWAILLFFTVTTSMCLLLRGNIASTRSQSHRTATHAFAVLLVQPGFAFSHRPVGGVFDLVLVRDDPVYRGQRAPEGQA